MNEAAALLDRVLRCGVLVVLRDGAPKIESPLGRTLPDTLRAELKPYREEIVAELAWRTEAIGVIADGLARIEAAYLPGCALDGDELIELEGAIGEAFRAHDRIGLRTCVDAYRLACWRRSSGQRSEAPMA